MKAAGDFLRAADPLRYEPIWTPPQRLAVKRHVLAATPGRPVTPSQQRRAVIAAGCASLLMVVVSFVPRFSSPVMTAPVRFEMRLAEIEPAPGLEAVRVPPRAETIYIHREAIVSNADIAAVAAVPVAGLGFGVQISFNAAGAEKIERATMNHVGKPIAFLIDGNVVAVPTLRSPVRSQAQLSANFTRAEAERLAVGMIGQ
jgi:hypothetical protein